MKNSIVTITDDIVSVTIQNVQMSWFAGKIIHTVLLINTDEGPWLPDVWLTLIDDNGKCMIPQGAKGFDQVYDIVSKFDGFDFESAIKSMSCTDNAPFLLWTNSNQHDKEHT